MMCTCSNIPKKSDTEGEKANTFIPLHRRLNETQSYTRFSVTKNKIKSVPSAKIKRLCATLCANLFFRQMGCGNSEEGNFFTGKIQNSGVSDPILLL